MRTVILFFLVISLAGCATAKPPAPQKAKTPPASAVKNNKYQLHNIQTEEIGPYAEKKGVIFAKTDFVGILKTKYVRLMFEDVHTGDVFQLYIADKTSGADFPSWMANPVEPGYFFIELPAGTYKISSVSIPVGSALATETSEIRFDVLPNAIVYLGTLKMTGIKEKIKLGGFPVIQPGFDYDAAVVDEQAEGIKAFREKYPQVTDKVVVQLMKLNAPAGS